MKLWILAVALMCLACVGLTACQGTSAPAPSPQAEPAPAPTAVVADQSAVWAGWQGSPHAQTYDLGKGPNTYCARCHAPRNWDPAAVIDPPPNCVSCKFAFEDEPRVAAGNPPVPREQWLDIRCDVCHEVREGLADPQPVWWDQETAQYMPVPSSSALCAQCHRDTETLRHQRDLGDAAHVDFECTECHDAHSVAASCATAGCHDDLSAENHAADVAHTAVSCGACHDAGGLEVGPLPENGAWVTWRTTELMGRESTEPYQAHNVARAVECARCHYAGNPWNLNTVPAGG